MKQVQVFLQILIGTFSLVQLNQIQLELILSSCFNSTNVPITCSVLHLLIGKHMYTAIYCILTLFPRSLPTTTVNPYKFNFQSFIFDSTAADGLIYIACSIQICTTGSFCGSAASTQQECDLLGDYTINT